MLETSDVMTWTGSNWIWILFALGMFAMHFFGHRHGHGSAHGNRHDHAPADPADGMNPQAKVETSGVSGPAVHPHTSLGEDNSAAPRSSIVPRIAPSRHTASGSASAATAEYPAHDSEARPTKDQRHHHHC